jgi:hypothetical protein
MRIATVRDSAPTHSSRIAFKDESQLPMGMSVAARHPSPLLATPAIWHAVPGEVRTADLYGLLARHPPHMQSGDYQTPGTMSWLIDQGSLTGPEGGGRCDRIDKVGSGRVLDGPARAGPEATAVRIAAATVAWMTHASGLTVTNSIGVDMDWYSAAPCGGRGRANPVSSTRPE